MEDLLFVSNTVYPNVTDLVLHINNPPSATPYVGAFNPNLTHLRMEDKRTVFEETLQFSLSVIRRSFELMAQDQVGHSLAGYGEPYAWKNIQTYTGALADLWALGVTCPIYRLIPTDVPGVRHPRALTEVLASARPIHLTITLENQPLTNVLDSELLDALCSDGASGLSSLRLVIDLMVGDVDKDIDIGHTLVSSAPLLLLPQSIGVRDVGWRLTFSTSQTRFETVFSGLRLKDLQLVMRDIAPPETSNGQSATLVEDVYGNIAPKRADAAQATPCDPIEGTPSLPHHDEVGDSHASFTLAERTLEGFDVHAFVRRLSISIPTLQKAIVSIGRPRRCGGDSRTAYLGEHDDHDKPETHAFTRDHGLSERLTVLEPERATEKGFNSTWGAWSRAFHQGLRSVM